MVQIWGDLPKCKSKPQELHLGWLITWHMEALYNINQVKPNIWPLKVACSGNHSGGARFLPVSLSRPQYKKSEARKIGPPLLFSISGIVVSIHFASGSRPAAYFSFSDALMLLWSCRHTRSHQFPDLNSTFLLSDVLTGLFGNFSHIVVGWGGSSQFTLKCFFGTPNSFWGTKTCFIYRGM